MTAYKNLSLHLGISPTQVHEDLRANNVYTSRMTDAEKAEYIKLCGLVGRDPLGRRIVHALSPEGVFSAEALCAMTEAELLPVRGLGPQCYLRLGMVLGRLIAEREAGCST